MKDFHKALIAGAIIGASLGAISNCAHAQAVGQANHGHHGSLGSAGGSSTSGASASSGGTAGQSGNGSIYDCDITHYVMCEQAAAAKQASAPLVAKQ